MKKRVIIIFSLSICLLTILNVNTYLSKMDKSYNLALNNIEALANNENSNGGEDSSIKYFHCTKMITVNPGASTVYRVCIDTDILATVKDYVCSEYIRGYNLAGSGECRGVDSAKYY